MTHYFPCHRDADRQARHNQSELLEAVLKKARVRANLTEYLRQLLSLLREWYLRQQGIDGLTVSVKRTPEWKSV